MDELTGLGGRTESDSSAMSLSEGICKGAESDTEAMIGDEGAAAAAEGADRAADEGADRAADEETEFKVVRSFHGSF